MGRRDRWLVFWNNACGVCGRDLGLPRSLHSYRWGCNRGRVLRKWGSRLLAWFPDGTVSGFCHRCWSPDLSRGGRLVDGRRATTGRSHAPAVPQARAAPASAGTTYRARTTRGSRTPRSAAPAPASEGADSPDTTPVSSSAALCEAYLDLKCNDSGAHDSRFG